MVAERPPGPRGLPLLGVMPALRRDPIGVFRDAARRFGDVVHLRIGPHQGFLVNQPDAIRHVLQDNARNFHKSPLYDRLKVAVGNGLLTSEESYWLRQRRMAQPAFHRQRVGAMASVMAEAADELAARWAPIAARGEPVDVVDEMMTVTQTIVLRTLLGSDLGPFAAKLGSAWSLVNEHIGQSFWSLGLTDRWPTPKNRRFRRALSVLDAAVFHIIERRRQEAGAGDLVSMLLAARDEETGQMMTDRQLRDEVMTMLLAGHETTSLALAWTWYLISEHSDARERMEKELDRVLNGRLPSFGDLGSLPYTRMVIEEAMRLYPPAWGFSRQAVGADNLGGYPLAAGWLVFIIPFVMHRHPAYWPDPERFEPERFSAEQTAARPKFVYIPFGAGPRQCIGNQFAIIEAHLILATLAQRYRLELVPGHRVEPWPLITLRPRHGVRMRIRPRTA
jgi:cytochrome P450